MEQSSLAELEASIVALLRTDPLLASSMVPSGITAYFGESLDWPDWLLEGTPFAGKRQVPPLVSLPDGLRAFANMLVHVGELRLAGMMLEWPRFPLEAEALAAPDLGAALAFLMERVNLRNPTMTLEPRRTHGMVLVEVSIAPGLGAFRAGYEQIMLLWLFLVVRSILGMSRKGRALLDGLRISRVHSDPAGNALMGCKAASGSGTAFVAIPEAALAFVGPDFKPGLWAGVMASDQSMAGASPPDLPPQLASLGALIMRTLVEQGRVPQLAEVAQMLDCSERTLARRLARAGHSYRQIVVRVRMGLAADMLTNSIASVRDVGMRLGYSDDTAFVRSFRRHFGRPPSRWRDTCVSRQDTTPS